MRGYNVYPSDFVELLEAFPSGIARVQEYLLKDFHILVDAGDPHKIWNKIEAERGEEGAADVVSELVILRGELRVAEMIRRVASDEEPGIRANDSQLARLLFQEDDQWRRPEVGEYVVDYFNRTRSIVDESEEEEWSEGALTDSNDYDRDAEGEDDIQVDDAEPVYDEKLRNLIEGKPRRSASDDAAWSLERIQTPRRGFLEVPHSWKEADRRADTALVPATTYAELSPSLSQRTGHCWLGRPLKRNQSRRGGVRST